MKCIICGRETSETYCEFHGKAYQKIVLEFENWQQATEASWKEYLKAIIEHSYTGVWAKEVAMDLLKKDD